MTCDTAEMPAYRCQFWGWLSLAAFLAACGGSCDARVTTLDGSTAMANDHDGSSSRDQTHVDSGASSSSQLDAATRQVDSATNEIVTEAASQDASGDARIPMDDASCLEGAPVAAIVTFHVSNETSATVYLGVDPLSHCDYEAWLSPCGETSEKLPLAAPANVCDCTVCDSQCASCQPGYCDDELCDLGPRELVPGASTDIAWLAVRHSVVAAACDSQLMCDQKTPLRSGLYHVHVPLYESAAKADSSDAFRLADVEVNLPEAGGAVQVILVP